MKILVLSGGFPPASGAGAEKVAFSLAKCFQELGKQVYIITTVQSRAEAGRLDYQGLTIFRIYANYHQHWQGYLGLYNPQTIGRIEAIIKQIRPDITHVHVPHHYLSYYCLKIAQKNSKAVFLTAHDVMLFHYGKLIEFINNSDLSIPKNFNYKITFQQQIKRFKRRYNPFRNIVIRHYLKYVDKIFAVSYALKDALNQNGIDNVEVIHNGINMDSWEINDNKLNNFKKEYNLFNKKIIFFGGRLNDWKGGEKILMALKIITKQVPESVLLVAGKRDNYTQKMLESAQTEKLSLKLTGWLEEDELRAAYACSDVVVTPSLCLDTFNMMNVEAMVCKKPVVGTCFGGAPEIIIDNQTGYIVNPLDIQTMAEKITDLLIKTDKAKQFGEAGCVRAKKEFNLKKQTQQYLDWFEKYAQ